MSVRRNAGRHVRRPLISPSTTSRPATSSARKSVHSRACSTAQRIVFMETRAGALLRHGRGARRRRGRQGRKAKLVSLAKARCSDAYVLAANEGVQIFAGVGMTDEYDIGFYHEASSGGRADLRRCRPIHRNRWADDGQRLIKGTGLRFEPERAVSEDLSTAKRSIAHRSG